MEHHNIHASSPLLYIRNDGLVNIGGLTASQIVETDANKNLVSAAKGTAYNKNFGTTAGTVLEGSAITQTITNGDTTHAPSGDVIFDALALKANLASPNLTGSPTAPTQPANDNSTKIATTAYVDTKESLLFTGASVQTNLLDSTTYYFGLNNGASPSTTQGFNRFQFPRNFTVTKVILTVSQNSNYSNEAVSLYLRESLTTDKTITTSLDFSTIGLNACKVFVYSGLSISVSSGLDYELKLVTQAFATNGTNSRLFIQIWGY